MCWSEYGDHKVLEKICLKQMLGKYLKGKSAKGLLMG